MKKGLGLLVAFSAISCSAFGAQISFSHTTPTQTNPFSDTFTLANFDPTLGTLTAIMIDFTANTSATLSIVNISGLVQAFTNGSASVPLLLTAPTGTTAVTATAGPISGVVPAVVGPTNFPGLTGTLIAPTLNVLPAFFTTYEAPPSASNSTFTVSGTAGTFSGTSNPGLFFGGSANAGGTTKITYTYSPVVTGNVPEPSTLGLIGSALVGLGFLRLRKKA